MPWPTSRTGGLIVGRVRGCHTRGMLGIVLFLLAAWLVISILGLVIQGLFWLFVIGVILFAGTAVWGWLTKD